MTPFSMTLPEPALVVASSLPKGKPSARATTMSEEVEPMEAYGGGGGGDGGAHATESES